MGGEEKGLRDARLLALVLWIWYPSIKMNTMEETVKENISKF